MCITEEAQALMRRYGADTSNERLGTVGSQFQPGPGAAEAAAAATAALPGAAGPGDWGTNAGLDALAGAGIEAGGDDSSRWVWRDEPLTSWQQMECTGRWQVTGDLWLAPGCQRTVTLALHHCFLQASAGQVQVAVAWPIVTQPPSVALFAYH